MWLRTIHVDRRAFHVGAEYDRASALTGIGPDALFDARSTTNAACDDVLSKELVLKEASQCLMQSAQVSLLGGSLFARPVLDDPDDARQIVGVQSLSLF